MRRVAGFLIAVGVLFAAATVVKSGSSGRSGNADSSTVSAEERDRSRRFWETYRRATEHRIAGRVQEAANEYTRALALNPEHQDALYYLGNMELELGNLDAAEHAWKRLIEIDPTSARAHSQLGTLYFCVGEEQILRPDRAVAEFQRAAAINREETGPLLSLGEIALVQEHMDTAQYYFDAVIGSHYSSMEAHFYKGYIAWKSGGQEAASELLTAAALHARPAAPTDKASGEGDTRTGAAPMVRAPARCGAMRVRADELATLDADVTPSHVAAVYRAFDQLLQDIRRKLP